MTFRFHIFIVRTLLEFYQKIILRWHLLTDSKNGRKMRVYLHFLISKKKKEGQRNHKDFFSSSIEFLIEPLLWTPYSSRMWAEFCPLLCEENDNSKCKISNFRLKYHNGPKTQINCNIHNVLSTTWPHFLTYKCPS